MRSSSSVRPCHVTPYDGLRVFRVCILTISYNVKLPWRQVPQVLALRLVCTWVPHPSVFGDYASISATTYTGVTPTLPSTVNLVETCTKQGFHHDSSAAISINSVQRYFLLISIAVPTSIYPELENRKWRFKLHQD